MSTSDKIEFRNAVEGEWWQCGAELRFVRRPMLVAVGDYETIHAQTILQQRWQSLTTGMIEWRDVPLVEEGAQ
jgi:hypothetical protein